jgi:chemotaxis protein methyltransferase CheR
MKEIPAVYLGTHWARGTGAISHFAKVKDHIKNKISFHTLNLKNIEEEPSVGGPFDLIFCRNVFIYFDRPRIQSVLEQMRDRLVPGGMLFLGLSEPITDPLPALRSLGNSIYSHVPNGFEWEERITTIVPMDKKQAASEIATAGAAEILGTGQKKLRVLCVDDSATIIAVLKTIFTAEHQFEVVATATNGLEASQILKTTPVDVVTLDIHMPEQDGISYLQKNMNPAHPPVLVITSASREDPKSAQLCLELGAIDVVEKPSLLNIQDRGEEIRNKLRAAWTTRALNGKRTGPAEIEIAFKAPEPQSFKSDALRILIASSEDGPRIKTFLKSLPPHQPQTMILFHGTGVDPYAEATQISLRGWVRAIESVAEIAKHAKDQLLVGEFKRLFPQLKVSSLDATQISLLVFGRVPVTVELQLIEWRRPQVVLEDLPQATQEKSIPLLARVDYCVPVTSFQYHSDRHLKGQ